MISAIAAAATAPSVVADETLDDARIASADASLRSGGDAFLVGTAEKPLHQTKAVEQPGRKQLGDDREVPLIVRGHGDVRQQGANLIGDVADQAMQHRRHQRAFLLRQTLGGVEEKIDTDSGQPVRPARAQARSGRLQCSNRPFFRHHRAGDYPICVNFPSTDGEWRTCWTMKKDTAA